MICICKSAQYLSFLHLLRQPVSPNADHRSGCWNIHTPPQTTSLPTHACGSFQPHSFLFCTENLAPGIQQAKLINTVSAQSSCQVICKAPPQAGSTPTVSVSGRAGWLWITQSHQRTSRHKTQHSLSTQVTPVKKLIQRQE